MTSKEITEYIKSKTNLEYVSVLEVLMLAGWFDEKGYNHDECIEHLNDYLSRVY